MELFEAIRRDCRLEELSIRALAEWPGVHRRTVRQALAAAAPPTRKPWVDLAMERPLLRSLPADGFDPGLSLTPRVDQYARVMVRQCQYSLPSRLIGRRVRVSLRAPEVVAFERPRAGRPARRSVRKGSTVLLLDHYLEVLARKPWALPGATALAQAQSTTRRPSQRALIPI